VEYDYSKFFALTCVKKFLLMAFLVLGLFMENTAIPGK
jgi:hypothetical protein